MYIGNDWDPLDVGEDDVFTIDFCRDLLPNETITSVACICVVAPDSPGVDPAPVTRLSGAAVFAGSKVSQAIAGALAGVKYRLIMSCVTSIRPEISRWSNFLSQDPTQAPAS